MSDAPCPCPERELLLHGLADGELDAANALALEDHMRSCKGCAAAYGEIMRGKALLARDGLRSRAPAGLRSGIGAAIAAENGAASRAPFAASAASSGLQGKARGFFLGYGGAAFSAMALAASLILFVSSWNQALSLDDQLVAAHVRSLLVSHLTDVTSTDRHTVKPWFLGKLDFAPAVKDLAKDGFPLIGGRLDYLAGRVVPALVYKRGGHVINLFVWPEGKVKASSETLDGYNIVGWTKGGFSYAAISDLNLAELGDFKRAFENEPA